MLLAIWLYAHPAIGMSAAAAVSVGDETIATQTERLVRADDAVETGMQAELRTAAKNIAAIAHEGMVAYELDLGDGEERDALRMELRFVPVRGGAGITIAATF
ncbi:MAG: hypothetical protein R3A78_16715 [Polyangiales bacterium]